MGTEFKAGPINDLHDTNCKQISPKATFIFMNEMKTTSF